MEIIDDLISFNKELMALLIHGDGRFMRETTFSTK